MTSNKSWFCCGQVVCNLRPCTNSFYHSKRHTVRYIFHFRSSLRWRLISITWCISFRLILSLRMWHHHLLHALVMKPWCAFTLVWMNYVYCLKYVASAFKTTNLIYILKQKRISADRALGSTWWKKTSVCSHLTFVG